MMGSQSEPAGRQRKALRIHPADNVAVALEDIPANSSAILLSSEQTTISIAEPIPFAHKLALADIGKGEFIYKYGVPIAVATADITQGEWVHQHNASSRLNLSRSEAAR